MSNRRDERYAIGPPIEVPGGADPMYGMLRYPGSGYLPRPGENRPDLSPWARLARGQPLGKSVNLAYNSNSATSQPISILQVSGDDADARQLIVTLGQPRVLSLAFSQTLAQSNPTNLSGEQDNAEMLERGNFPGTASPCAWPPFEAIIEWGVGGVSFKASVDFVNGSTIALVCTFLRVHGAVTANQADSGISGTSAIYALSAFVGPGFAQSHARKTIYVGSLDLTEESDVFPVPPFARTALVVGQDPAALPAVTVATIRFWQAADGVAGATCVGNFFISGNQSIPVPVPAGAAYASVLSGTGATSRFSIVYDLAI